MNDSMNKLTLFFLVKHNRTMFSYWLRDEEHRISLYIHYLECFVLFQLRPVVETGYENLLLVRLLVEIQIPSVRKSSVSSAVLHL